VLDVAESMPPEATPSALDKQLGRQRSIPRYREVPPVRILEALAEAGVLYAPASCSASERHQPKWRPGSEL